MTSRFGRIVSALALPMLATPALAQNFNNLELTNGGDGLFIYNDPSIGAPLGQPLDPDGDYYWKVYPKEVMNHPLGVMTIDGSTIEIYDTDWVATPTDTSFDSAITTAMNNPGFPGNLVPDLASPIGFQLLGVASFGGQLTNPCPALGPTACSGACPLPGFVVGYVVGLSVVDPVTNTGIPIQADGFTEWTFGEWVPGGQTYSGGGSCGSGDGVIQDVHSSNVFTGSGGELQSDILATGYSRYGGFHIGGTGIGTENPDNLDEVFASPLEFTEPISEARNDVGLGAQLGLAALNPSASGVGLGMRLTSLANQNELGFFFGSFFPLLPAPGIPIFDINIMINIADPVAGTIAGLWNGAIIPGQGTFNDDAWVDTLLVPMPPAAVGFTLNVQGFGFDPVSLDFDNSQCVSLPIQP